MIHEFGNVVLVPFHEPQKTFDEIGHVAERAGLLAIAEHGQRLAGQRLHHEVGHHSPIVLVHARAVGAEDARDADLNPVLARVACGQGLGAALALVVAGARSDGIHGQVGMRLNE